MLYFDIKEYKSRIEKTKKRMAAEVLMFYSFLSQLT